MRKLRFALVFASLGIAMACSPGKKLESQPPPEVPRGKVLVARLPDGVEGLVLGDGFLKVQTGYRLESQADGTTSVVRQRDGAIVGKGSCGCKSTGGTCDQKKDPTGYLYCGGTCTKCVLVDWHRGIATDLILY